MARITVEDCLEKVENQYDLVLLSKRKNISIKLWSKNACRRRQR